MRTEINLLPVWARNVKSRRKLVKILAAAQVVIFLVLAAAVAGLDSWEQETWSRSNELSNALAAFDSAPSEVAAELQSAREEAFYIEEFFAEAGGFDAGRLDYIAVSTPDGAALARIDFAQNRLVLTGITADIDIMEIHRANLSEFFENVSTGRITLTDDGLFAYEIRVFFNE